MHPNLVEAVLLRVGLDEEERHGERDRLWRVEISRKPERERVEGGRRAGQPPTIRAICPAERHFCVSACESFSHVCFYLFPKSAAKAHCATEPKEEAFPGTLPDKLELVV